MTPHQAVLYSSPSTFRDSFLCFSNCCAGAGLIRGRILYVATNESEFGGRLWKLTAYSTLVITMGQENVQRAFICLCHED